MQWDAVASFIYAREDWGMASLAPQLAKGAASAAVPFHIPWQKAA